MYINKLILIIDLLIGFEAITYNLLTQVLTQVLMRNT